MKSAPNFRVVVLKHDYVSVEHERRIVTAEGGEFVDAENMTEVEMLRLCEQADGILVRWVKVGSNLIKRLSRCRIIVRYGVGTDNVDVNAATEAGIIVGHVPHYCTDEVATHAIALLLACVRNLLDAQKKMERGVWELNPTERLWRMNERTLGLVGFGCIGQAVARKMSGWGLRLLASDPYVDAVRADALGVKLVDLETLCRESDYVSLHVPLLPETRHLLNARTLALIKPGAILINTARGQVLDTEALLTALESGRIAKAGLDVFDEEPLPATSPLRAHPRMIVTNHVAWYSEESQTELQVTAAEEAVRVCTGGLPHSLTNPEVLHRLGRFADWTPSDNVRWRLIRLERLSRSDGTYA